MCFFFCFFLLLLLLFLVFGECGLMSKKTSRMLIFNISIEFQSLTGLLRKRNEVNVLPFTFLNTPTLNRYASLN